MQDDEQTLDEEEALGEVDHKEEIDALQNEGEAYVDCSVFVLLLQSFDLLMKQLTKFRVQFSNSLCCFNNNLAFSFIALAEMPIEELRKMYGMKTDSTCAPNDSDSDTCDEMDSDIDSLTGDESDTANMADLVNGMCFLLN